MNPQFGFDVIGDAIYVLFRWLIVCSDTIWGRCDNFTSDRFLLFEGREPLDSVANPMYVFKL